MMQQEGDEKTKDGIEEVETEEDGITLNLDMAAVNQVLQEQHSRWQEQINTSMTALHTGMGRIDDDLSRTLSARLVQVPNLPSINQLPVIQEFIYSQEDRQELDNILHGNLLNRFTQPPANYGLQMFDLRSSDVRAEPCDVPQPKPSIQGREAEKQDRQDAEGEGYEPKQMGHN